MTRGRGATMTSQPDDALGGPDRGRHEDELGGDAPGREDELGGGDRAAHEDELSEDAPGREDELGGDAPGREDELSDPES